MKNNFIATVIIFASFLGACQKDKAKAIEDNYEGMPRTQVPATLQGNWMYGNFSMTEYWGQNPADYLGNALQYAVAFTFNANGSYEQYFTSSTVSSGIVTYQQSVTKGTVEVDAVNKTIKTYAYSAHYKRTRGGQVVEERDLTKSELTSTSSYSFTTGTEPNATKAIYLTLQGTANPLTFLQKF